MMSLAISVIVFLLASIFQALLHLPRVGDSVRGLDPASLLLLLALGLQTLPMDFLLGVGSYVYVRGTLDVAVVLPYFRYR